MVWLHLHAHLTLFTNLYYMLEGANKITQATPTYFMIVLKLFLGNIAKIFFKIFLKKKSNFFL
jgi:hypothetical protein